LPADRASLNVVIVYEGVLDARSTPIASPDHSVFVRQVPEEREITLPGGLSIDIFHEITCEAIVMNADFFELGCPLIV
jgi:hypothetical protein